MLAVSIPTNPETAHYGVREQRAVSNGLDRAAEEITCLGYTVIDSGYSVAEIQEFGRRFNAVRRAYLEQFGESFLREINEHHGIRLPLAFDDCFLDLAMNERVLQVARTLIRNELVLNQQNGVINPAGQSYNQGAWHRDLPYQHFVASRPLAINALFCIDDFTPENGATLVLPASHQQELFPSDSYVERHVKQIVAPAGSFIMMDCMMFHRGGCNTTGSDRRGVNHVYTAAFIKQQIDIPSALADRPIPTKKVADLLGYRYQIPRSITAYLDSRRR